MSDTTQKECCAREAVVSVIPEIYAAIYCLWNHDLGGSPAIYVHVDDHLAASLTLPVLEGFTSEGAGLEVALMGGMWMGGFAWAIMKEIE